jgi:hypothetical protein
MMLGHRVLRLLLLPLVLAACACAGPADSPYTAGQLVCRFQDPRIRESSGLAASSRSDDYFFTHNDSGNEPLLFAVNRKGETVACWRVEGAANLDWEDMARGPDEAGKPALYLGDIGDNLTIRALITVYRVPEPQPDPAHPGLQGTTPRAARFDLKYEDGAHDAETLMVHPRTGQLFVVTKSEKGSGVYAAPLPLRKEGPNLLRKVASIDFAALATSSGAGGAGMSRTATGGDIAPDVTPVVVRTYTDAWEWKVENGEVARAFQAAPVRIALPASPGGEAIAYRRDGRGLLLSCEGVNAPVHELARRP